MMKQFIMYILFKFKIHRLISLNWEKDVHIPIITFHRVSNDHSYAYPALKVRHFELIIKYIKRNFNPIHINEIGTSLSSEKPKIVITFDDGYKNFLHIVLPILKKYKIKVTQNVVIDTLDNGHAFWTHRLNSFLDFIYENKKSFKFKNEFLDINYNHKSLKKFNKLCSYLFTSLIELQNKERLSLIIQMESIFNEYKFQDKIEFMNWEDLIYCYKEGVEIGSHSKTHDILTTIFKDSILEDEIYFSKKMIEKRLNNNINIFTFPNGKYKQKTLDTVYRAKYKFALTTEEKYYVIDKNQKLKILPRIQMHHDNYFENVMRIYGFQIKLKSIFSQ